MRTKWFVISGLLVVAVAIFVLPYFVRKDLALPKALGSMQLREEIRGERANTIINNMHGKRVTPKDNMIALYESDEGTATAYLSVYDSRTESETTFGQMVSGIEKGISPFADLRRMKIRGHDVAFCIGFGQAHYFFFVEESVYWLTADFAVAEEAVNGLFAELRGPGITV